MTQAASLWDWNHRQAACLTALPGLTHPKSISGISGMEGPLRVVRTKSGPRQGRRSVPGLQKTLFQGLVRLRILKKRVF